LPAGFPDPQCLRDRGQCQIGRSQRSKPAREANKSSVLIGRDGEVLRKAGCNVCGRAALIRLDLPNSGGRSADVVSQFGLSQSEGFAMALQPAAEGGVRGMRSSSVMLRL
jgi:pyruvate carboxylase